MNWLEARPCRGAERGAELPAGFMVTVLSAMTPARAGCEAI